MIKIIFFLLPAGDKRAFPIGTLEIVLPPPLTDGLTLPTERDSKSKAGKLELDDMPK